VWRSALPTQIQTTQSNDHPPLSHLTRDVTPASYPFCLYWQKTHAFVASPEMVVATALAGSVTFDPATDSIPTPDGGSFKFEAPFGKELPVKGFDPGEDTFQVWCSVVFGASCT